MNYTETLGTRFLQYKNILKKLKALGFNRVCSSDLADTQGISASLVRKDFANLATSGNKKGGYHLDTLLDEIQRLLKKDVVTRAVLAGVGKLGLALCNYTGFEEESITIAAAFDADPDKTGDESRVPVYSMDKMSTYIAENKITIGVLAVPGTAAQQVADQMVIAGIRGILNFTPVRLVLPDSVLENHVNLALELERLVYQVGTAKAE